MHAALDISPSALLLTSLLSQTHSVLGQFTIPPGPPGEVQPNDYNATVGSPYYSQAADVIAAANIDNATAHRAQVAIDFERSNWATGSVHEDPFYALPANASGAYPGDLLKVQQAVNATGFTLPPNVAMSRFQYQTETFNGTCVPTSAYVLWPWMPRSFPNVTGFPVVAWAHGTSGNGAECAPSHLQDLWYQYATPFALALQGYVVIGTDYAGLGINQTADGQPIVHQWAANPAGANDVMYSVEAARKAWPTELSEEFVVIGHSEGGGVAWGAAQRQASKPLNGYLGTVAGSPITDYTEYTKLNVTSAGPFVTLALGSIASIIPEFKPSDWLTAVGSNVLTLYNDLNGCQGFRFEIGTNSHVAYLKPNWKDGWIFSTFNRLVANGGRPFAGPMLVLQGTHDPVVNIKGTDAAVNATCEKIEGADLEYVTLEGVTHVPAMYAGQSIWLDWIADRFMGRETAGRCTSRALKPVRPVEDYQEEVNYYMERLLYAYEKA